MIDNIMKVQLNKFCSLDKEIFAIQCLKTFDADSYLCSKRYALEKVVDYSKFMNHNLLSQQ